jgi:hypothetical protein
MVVVLAVSAAVSALAAAGGVLRRFGMPKILADRLDPLALRGLRAGVLGLVALLAAGALLLTLATALSARTVSSLFAPTFGDSFGLFLLSLLYLPNAVVAATSFVSGPGFSIGGLDVHLVGYRGGAVPGVPLLGGIPEHSAPWWPVLMLLPLAVGLLVGWSVRAVDADPAARLRVVVVAGAVVGFGCVLLGTLAGGRLGDGPFDPVSVPVGVASIVAFCWVVIPAGFVAFFAGEHAPPQPVGLEPDDGEDDSEADTADAAEADAAEADAEDEDESDEDAAETDGDAEEAEAEDDADESADSEDADADSDDEAEEAAPEEEAAAEEVVPEEPEYDEFDAEADAELGLELPEDEADAPAADQAEAVTESTGDSGDAKPADDDR